MASNDNHERLIPSVTKVNAPKTLADKHSLAFKPEESNQTFSVYLTQGELIDTWLAIGAYLNLNGLRNEAYSAYLHLDETED